MANVPKLFNIPFELISDPDDDLQTWELELFTCRFLLLFNPNRNSKVTITKDMYGMYKCNTLDEATEYLTAQLKPSLEQIHTNTSPTSSPTSSCRKRPR